MNQVPETNFRRARRNDVSTIRAIIAASLEEHGLAGARLIPVDVDGFHVVEVEGVVLGCAAFTARTTVPKTAELRGMHFARELRGHGVGHRFLAHLLSEMRGSGFRECWLETHERMAAARHLYRSHGFHDVAAPAGSLCNCAMRRRL